MKCITYTVSGDALSARNAVYDQLFHQNFKITETGPWTADAERGSGAASFWLGAAAGKGLRHCKILVSCASNADGYLEVTLKPADSGWSGGLIGKSQADSIYTEVYNAVTAALQSAGVLVTQRLF